MSIPCEAALPHAPADCHPDTPHMVVGVLQVKLTIDWASSLKDKRRVVSSLKDRLHREHQVSVAEVGSLDSHRVAVLGDYAGFDRRAPLPGCA